MKNSVDFDKSPPPSGSDDKMNY